MIFRAVLQICILGLLILASVIDIKKRIIPNYIDILVLLIGFLLIPTFENPLNRFLSGLLGFLAAVILCVVVRVLFKDGMGMGDIKLIIALGFTLTINGFIEMLFLTSIISLIGALFMILKKHADRRAKMPFAPYLAVGTGVSIIFDYVLEFL